MDHPETERSSPPPLTDPASRFRRAHETAEPRAGVGVTVVQSCLIAGCVTVIVPLLLCAGFFITVYALISSGIEDSSLDGFGGNSQGVSITEKVIRAGGGAGTDTIAVIAVTGAIDGDGSPIEGDGMVYQVSAMLRAAAEDDDVRAVLLQIDSPGGGLTASDQLYNEVLRLKEKDKTVIAWAGNLMASGGYYIAAGADGIMASPTSTVGSIGVIMRHFQASELLRKIGVVTDPIASGDRKDIGSPFREMTPEERDLLQEYVDASHRRFMEIVAGGRNMPLADVEPLADGSIFTAQDALDKNLVDRIGYIEDAIAWTEETAGGKNMRVVVYRPQFSLSDIFREMGRGAAAAAIESAASAPSAPKAMTVWEGR